ncbi:hypothetical protein HGRIS_014362 [Hohenbuehelia grisea]|uniref:Major facilitator superfamily (MFS) profile domain-containing protein n=1 Tax=Hohenbuehelia grisea TaxID=104357 RepID=A0ABR3JU60_9AGAR
MNTPESVVANSSSTRSSLTLMDGRTESQLPQRSPLDKEIHQGGLGYDDNDAKGSFTEKSGSISSKSAFTEASIDPNLVEWDGPHDPENPYNWSKTWKWALTGVCILSTLNVTFASSAPTAATQEVITAFGISAQVSYLMTTTFLLGYVFGPLFWGPGSELLGRRPIFVFAMSAYTLLFLGQSMARNIETLLVTRFLSGFFAVAPLTVVGGTIADIWEIDGRGTATSLFTAGVFSGPILGPIVAGFIVESYLSWRWVFWVMMIFGGACTLLVIVALPETYAPVLLQKRARRLRKSNPEQHRHVYADHERQDWTIRGVLHRTLFRPFIMMALEPILILLTIYTSLAYAILFALFQAIPIIFSQKRGFSVSQVGLVFIGVGIGTTTGSFINYLTTRRYRALIPKWKGFPPPEERLIGALIGGPGLVVGIFWLGWTGNYPDIPWYVPCMSTVLVGMSISCIMISFLSYLIDTYGMYSASAFAANVMLRSGTAAAFPLFTTQMFMKLGVNWACTLLGLISLILAPSPFLFRMYGPRIRKSSKFAPCIDLRIAKELEEERERERGSV